ncbi:hypothetical protein ACFLT0_01475 [Chloroflexota bacterium]
MGVGVGVGAGAGSGAQADAITVKIRAKLNNILIASLRMVNYLLQVNCYFMK